MRFRAFMCCVSLACIALAPDRARAQAITRRAAGGRAGSVHEDAFLAASLGTPKHVVVYLPPSYASSRSKRFPVAYYLHGFSGSETDWVSKAGIDGVADSLFAAGLPEAIIVLPDGDDGWYTNWVDQFSFATCADTLHSEAPDKYCVEHERYDDYIARDVIEYIDAHYRTLSTRAHRGIGGLSMGGYGAVSLALSRPDVFGAAASHSGVLSPTYVGGHPFSAPGKYASTVDEIKPAAGGYWARYLHYWGTDLERWRDADPGTLAARARTRAREMPALFVDCGADDPFIDQNRAFHATLERLGVAHAYAEWPGAHTWRYWSTHVRESLAWMLKQIG